MSVSEKYRCTGLYDVIIRPIASEEKTVYKNATKTGAAKTIF
jgi:hypothetical protein